VVGLSVSTILLLYFNPWYLFIFPTTPDRRHRVHGVAGEDDRGT
jgi:hypothetical protein